VILASHSVVRNELFLYRKTILEKIQQLPGCGAYPLVAHPCRMIANWFRVSSLSFGFRVPKLLIMSYILLTDKRLGLETRNPEPRAPARHFSLRVPASSRLSRSCVSGYPPVADFHHVWSGSGRDENGDAGWRLA